MLQYTGILPKLVILHFVFFFFFYIVTFYLYITEYNFYSEITDLEIIFSGNKIRNCQFVRWMNPEPVI